MKQSDCESLLWRFDNNNEFERQEVTEQMFNIYLMITLTHASHYFTTVINFKVMITELDAEQLLTKMTEAHKKLI